MAHQNNNMDLETENVAEQPRRMTTRASAHLLEKLKKLQDTPKPNLDLMECNPDDAKKRTHATTLQGGGKQSQATTRTDGHSPDIKQSRNGATPTPMAKAKHVDCNLDNSSPTDKEDIYREEVMESIMEDEDPEDDPTPATIPQVAHQSAIRADSNNIETKAPNQEDMVKPEEGNDETTKDLVEVPVADIAADSKNPPENKQAEAEDKEPETLDEEPEPIQEVDPKEWR